MTKEQANYKPAVKWGQRCGTCDMLVHILHHLKDACTLVKGEIDPKYTCKYWEAKKHT